MMNLDDYEERWGEPQGDNYHPTEDDYARHDGDANDVYNSSGASQRTGSVLDDVPLDGESPHVPFFPATLHDNDTAAELRQRKHAEKVREYEAQKAREQQRANRRARYNALLDRVLNFIEDKHLLPKSCFDRSQETGQRFPKFVHTIQNEGPRWLTIAASLLSCVVSILFLGQWMLGAPTATMHDGTTVINLWKPPAVASLDLTSHGVATWITDHRDHVTFFSSRDMNAEYFSADIYQAGEKHNVTISHLDGLLKAACDPHPHINEPCICIPAVEIGIMANAIYMDKMVMYNPRVTAKSPEKFAFTFEDDTVAAYPIAIAIEFLHRDGQLGRTKVKLEQSACIMRSLDLVGRR